MFRETLSFNERDTTRNSASRCTGVCMFAHLLFSFHRFEPIRRRCTESLESFTSLLLCLNSSCGLVGNACGVVPGGWRRSRRTGSDRSGRCITDIIENRNGKCCLCGEKAPTVFILHVMCARWCFAFGRRSSRRVVRVDFPEHAVYTP